MFRPGLPVRVLCSNKSKIARAERKVKACFRTLLRRSRFSRQSLKDRASRTQSESLLSNFAEAKPIFEAKPQRAPSIDFDSAKLDIKKGIPMLCNGMPIVCQRFAKIRRSAGMLFLILRLISMPPHDIGRTPFRRSCCTAPCPSAADYDP